MPEATPDLVINSVAVPRFAFCGTPSFNIDVEVTAGQEDFEDGVAYRLFVFVTSLLNPGATQLITRTGHVHEGDWLTPTTHFRLPVKVTPSAAGVDIYNYTAILVEGLGTPDPGDIPSTFFTGPTIVLC